MGVQNSHRRPAESLLRKVYLAWLAWAALGITIWWFLPLSGDAPGHGYELMGRLAILCAAQLPFSSFVLVASVRKWSEISGDLQFLGCFTLLFSIVIAGIASWWLFSFYW